MVGLKLQARDHDDVAVVSAILQDAIMMVQDMAFDAQAQSFVFAASRFRWEAANGPEPVYERINCAVTVSGVAAVQLQQIDQNNKTALHDLLAVMLEDNLLRLVFAGGAQIRLALGAWSMRLEDFGAAWPTEKCPRHNASETEVA